jgi:hypothetical protein
MRDVDSNPTAFELLGGMNGSAATAERIEDYIRFVAAGRDDAFQ